ncbi:hypothetical protein 20Sep418_00136 [Pseudomonas phage 20Sep418]|uniref:Uncharacterized protein n=5 Tax=Pakpunavirus TaxID=1921407 RepID=A0A9E6Q6L9_9CAUD|nr:hypothetical protein QE329_gp062 [Pseudomonas phage PhL_UNISO_PA-DSM_ph0034]YP_010763549.1 hypothetical protein QE331_gp025 [Pseudomonas phage 20Sep416]YP_010765208.1 hypothetical protein QE347_gp100 [Pseudomonas phage vB_Paer_Ps12]YP_010765592.1 hypothetical protein QE349_gp099 [Pseudomonas phage vB_Paer_PsCh]UOL47744.1 hypothetical protein vBPaerPs25_100 [Pseudomonas phage vB_Paer_Ps25]WFG37295.1 hypothetical protein 9081_00194 [Pseudomonas phage bmx-p3]WFG37811.1 hypothetical protein 20
MARTLQARTSFPGRRRPRLSVVKAICSWGLAPRV